MALRVLDSEKNEQITSLDYDFDSFVKLKDRYYSNKELLRCIECGSPMIPYQGKKRRLRWFQHQPRSDDTERNCDYKDKDPRHIEFQDILAEILRSFNLKPEIEKQVDWFEKKKRADTYCENGSDIFSIEVQLSPHDGATYIKRTREYLETDIQRILWISTEHLNQTDKRVPYVYLSDASGKELDKIGFRSMLNTPETAHITVPRVTLNDFEYITIDLKKWIELYVQKKVTWASCDFKPEPHWCRPDRCQQLKEEAQRKEEEKLRRMTEAQRQEEARLKREAEERAKQERIELEKREREAAERAEQIKKEREERKEKEAMKKAEERQKRIDLIDSLVDSPELYTCGIDKEDHSLYCYIYDLSLKKILKEQYIKEGSPIPWDEDAQPLLREYVISGGDYLDPEGYKKHGIPLQ